MLLLSRHENEDIVIPGLGVTIRVCEIRGRLVRLGITAPPDQWVGRAELVEDSRPVKETADAHPIDR